MTDINVCVCGTAFASCVVPEYLYNFLGIPLILVNAVTEYTCPNCGDVEIDIPDHEGLTAAVAVSRAKMHEKLNGSEIVFLRKSIDKAANVFAKEINVTPETLSRWENNKAPMPPLAETKLRLLVGYKLSDMAPAIDFNPEEVLEMQFKAIHKTMELTFERVRFKHESEDTEDKYAELKIQAA